MEENAVDFVGRQEELELIEDCLVSMREGQGSNLCFSGIPGAGKTSILGRYLQTRAEGWYDEGVILVPIPGEAVCTSAVDLARGWVAFTAGGFLRAVGAEDEAMRLFSEDTFPDEARRMRSRAVEAFLEQLERFTHTEGLEEKVLLRAAFAFPEAFAAEKNLRFVLYTDDFHLLDNIRTGRRAHPADLLAETLKNQTDVFHVVSVVPSLFTERRFIDEDGSFQAGFQLYPVQGLDKPDATELARKAFGDADDAAQRAWKLSGGIPFYLLTLARAARRAARDKAPEPRDVDRAFTSQVLASFGAVNRHFEALLTGPKSTAEDLTAAKSVLSLLASGKRMAREDLARASGKDGKALGSLLGRILNCGLFRRVGSSYYIDDPLFRFWASKSTGKMKAATGAFERLTGNESTELADAFLKETASKPATVVKPPENEEKPAPKPSGGKFNFRQMVARVKGRPVPGKFLAAHDDVVMPEFERVQGFAFSSRDIKVYYLTAGDEGWVLMVVWKSVPVEARLLEILERRAQGRAHGLWFVGKSGFSENAIAFAKEHEIYCSSESDLRKLMEVMS